MSAAVRKSEPSGPSARGMARLSAVQAVFQLLQSDDKASDVVEQFLKFRIAEGGDAGMPAEADRPFFRSLVSGVEADQAALMALVEGALASDWKIARLDRLMRAVLVTGVHEMKARRDVPAAVILSEYARVAGQFYQGNEPGFVTSVLDRIGRQLRPDEFAARDAQTPKDG
ncbi:transcription antitermination factor NusB [Vineibacter terrae]|uniref:Transcription antitermination protein NusB n=1 Tax=Vineibacter terrae TaxID=2586908 RepID=A0A5C8PFE2_9HYPH|nr:transcription antitermination factor NusB [Vineibacter terrae]TXL72497.1 transcription antitermination factor NusB [Vineibacter terrae]